MQALLLLLSTIFNIFSPITYIVSIARKKTKPHRMTRFILLFVLTLNFFSIVAAKGNFGAQLFAGITFFQATVIFILSIPLGMGGTTTLDWICLIIAGGGILGWKLTGNPLLGIWFAILADFAAYVPAFIKTWKHPHTESHWYYTIGFAGTILSLLAFPLEAASIFQMYIAASCVVMIAFIYRKELKKAVTAK